MFTLQIDTLENKIENLLYLNTTDINNKLINMQLSIQDIIHTLQKRQIINNTQTNNNKYTNSMPINTIKVKNNNTYQNDQQNLSKIKSNQLQDRNNKYNENNLLYPELNHTTSHPSKKMQTTITTKLPSTDTDQNPTNKNDINTIVLHEKEEINHKNLLKQYAEILIVIALWCVGMA